MIVGLGELQPLVGACEQFVGRLWNVFPGSNDFMEWHPVALTSYKGPFHGTAKAISIQAKN